MNLNQFTQKSVEAVQAAQQMASARQNQQIGGGGALQHQNPEIAFAIHQALLPSQENRFHGIPQAVKIDHGHDELGILRPQRDPKRPDGLVIP